MSKSLLWLLGITVLSCCVCAQVVTLSAVGASTTPTPFEVVSTAQRTPTASVVRRPMVTGRNTMAMRVNRTTSTIRRMGPNTAQPTSIVPRAATVTRTPGPSLVTAPPAQMRVSQDDPPRTGYEQLTVMTATGSTTSAIDLTDVGGINNLWITLKNTGTGDIRNPWVVVNGKRDWYDTLHILRDAIGNETDPEIKAFSIWRFMIDNIYHWYPAHDSNSLHDPARLLNVYGYGFCDDAAATICALFQVAGFEKYQHIMLPAHVVSQVYYDDAWHLMDADLRAFYPPMPTNRGAVGFDELTSNLELMARINTDALLDVYTTQVKTRRSDDFTTTTNMAMTLRPGEVLQRRFVHRDLYSFTQNYYKNTDVKPPVFSNGRHIYPYPETLSSGGFEAVDATKSVTMRTPYVYVGGKLMMDVDMKAGALLTVVGSSDNTVSHTMFRRNTPYTGKVEIPLSFLTAPHKAKECTQLQLTFTLTSPRGLSESTSTVRNIVVMADIQCAPNALPTLVAGQVNSVDVQLENAGGGQLQVEFAWETDPDVPPVLPVTKVWPEDGAVIYDASPTLMWESSVETSRPMLRQVVVSWDRDGRLPVSPVTMRLYTDTTAPGYAVQDGWLLPGNTYYWRVREVPDDCAPMDANWSGPWSFKVHEDTVPDWMLDKDF